MHLKVIACEVVAREVYHCAASARHTVDLTLLEQGLHNDPEKCRQRVQEEIDSVAAGDFDALLLGYGLCNNSLAGIAARDLHIIVPRAHDCLTLFLGSKERYQALFEGNPGTYYFTAEWLEFGSRDEDGHELFAQDSGLRREEAYQKLVAQFGEENAEFLWETQKSWEVNYTTGALITFPFTSRLGLEERVRGVCKEKGWEYRELEGDLTLLDDWLNGRWDTERFIILQPGQTLRATHDAAIMAASGCGSCGGCGFCCGKTDKPAE